jgi:hypothetical protein
MNRVASLLSRRVPIHVWVPIVLACGLVGAIASTQRSNRPVPVKLHPHRADAPSAAPVTERSRTNTNQQSLAPGLPGDTPAPLAPPVDEVGVRAEETPPSVIVTTPQHQRVAADHTRRSATKVRRIRRTVQRPASSPTASSATGSLVKTLPVIGSVVWMFK